MVMIIPTNGKFLAFFNGCFVAEGKTKREAIQKLAEAVCN